MLICWQKRKPTWRSSSAEKGLRVDGVLSDISIEMLIKLHERYGSGRTRFFVLVERCELVQCIQQRMIDAIEKELRRRLN